MTKVIATMWKKPYKKPQNQAMIDAGVDAFRIKCSHNTIDEIIESIQTCQKHIQESGRQVQILADLPEAKIRMGHFKERKIELKKGEYIIFKRKDGEEIPSIKEHIPIDSDLFTREIKEGNEFYCGDGQMRFKVLEVNSEIEFKAEAMYSGIVVERGALTCNHISEKLNHITPFVKEMAGRLQEVKPEIIAFSFVSSPEMMKELRDLIEPSFTENWKPKLIAKIESKKGVESIKEILGHADGAMVARGDLALTCGIESVGVLQKRITKATKESGKFLIVATQVLQSMADTKMPLRAEVLDVTNAVLDGADAVMLCYETAHSEHPEHAVEMAKKVIQKTEEFKKKDA